MSVWLLVCSADASVIRLESKLSMGENNSWVSSNGNFAIGFFRRGNQFSVGIRYNSVSIPESFQEVVWVAGCDSQVSGESHFELTENGELVLYDSGSGKIVWASNTTNASVTSAILRDDGNLVLINKNEDIVWQSFDTPCDTLLPGQNLSVSMSLRPHKSDGLSSYYSLYMNMSGELQLRWEASVIYWGKGEDLRPSVRAMLSSNGIFAVFDQTSRSVWSAYGTDHSDSDILFRFLRLDSDGNLRLYSWLDASKSWRIAWQAVGNQCEVWLVHDFTGNTVSAKYITSGKQCPRNLNNFELMCARRIQVALQCPSVDSGTASADEKDTQYISGWSDASLNNQRSICVRCLIGGAAGTFFLFVFIHLGVGVFIWRRTRHFKKQAGQTYAVPYYKGCVALSYSEISDMTENFKHQIGPKMHRGHLHDNKPVAVKTLDASIEEKIFRNRVSKLGSISHKSLVKLDGYCCDSNQRFIVYEFVKNGCLKKYLQDPKLSKKLPWEKRINICVTVAKAVSYLHTECREFVSHGNLKCENVVLDHNFEAKVSEFGLKSVTGNISDIEEKAENDVNDFGKIVIEVISGRTYDHDLCEWAYEKLIGAETDSIRDARMDAGVNPDELERALRIAFWCLQEDARMRPSMGEVVQVLEGTVTVDSPTYPFGKRHQSLPEESPESSPEVLNESIV
ncbi:hypothetical protein Leryth_001146 [Lithospermum erythrorhizon]|nr:hypothetical protein Leryth_001146 [Lithospermum erythrorhizon]